MTHARLVRVLALSLAALVAACTGRDRPIYIGVAAPFTDPIGEPALKAARLAVSEINAAGGIRGRPLALIEKDDHADPDSAVDAAVALYESDAVAVVGHVFSSTTLAAAPIYNGGRHPMVELSQSSSAPEVSAAGDFTFRLCPSDLAHGQALARWVSERLQLGSGAVLYLDDDYGRGIREQFVTEFQRRGGTVLGIDPYLGAAPDVGPYLDRLLRLPRRPQFLMVAGNRSEAEAVLRQARDRGLDVPLVGGDGLEGLEQAGALAQGDYVSAAYHPSLNSRANRDFIAAWKRAYPGAPLPNQPAAATYDGVRLLAEVIAEVGPDRAKVRQRLARVGRDLPAWDGVGGRIAFDSLGDVPSRQVYITVVRDGQVILAGGL